jgi:dihydrolipoamide dehydrogenase
MNAADHSYDVTIIGSGPGGYVAAVRAAQLGMKAAVVELHDQPGGTCLHWGCIPTKAMLHAADVLETARHAATFGIEVGEARLNLGRVHEYKAKTVQSNAKGVEYLFKKNGVALLAGRGRLAGPGRVQVTPRSGEPFEVRTRHTVLATGSVIRALPFADFDSRIVINSDDALRLQAIPRSMIVLGAGAVGVEFASIYRSFGVEVTLVELLPTLLPLEDEALGTELAKAFKKRGIASHTGTRVTEVGVGEQGARVRAQKDGKTLELEAELLLIAVGRRPRTEDLGLDRTGVRLDAGGFVEVDASMRTGEPGVYAIGDLLATPALAHVASREGIVAVEHAAGLAPPPIDYDRIPSCTYGQPEVASIGLTEREARKRGHDVVTGSFPFAAIGKAKILADTRGFVKLVADRRYDEVLGVHIIGPHATELISEATAALNLEATVASIFQAIHAHPTLSEAMGEAALAVHGRTIHA